MEPWIAATLAAAFVQNLRFMLQKHLSSTRLSAAGATFARFVYSAPLIALIVLGSHAATGTALPGFSPAFWLYALTGGTAQIVATICVVALFGQRHFAVGITFKKTEVIQTALIGALVLGEWLSLAATAAIAVGLAGLLLLSDPPRATGSWHRRIFNRAAGLGLASGLFFGVSSVGYRGASLSLGLDGAVQSAAVTLMMVTAFQTLALGSWLAWRERGEIGRVLASWRVSGLVGLTSMVGSFCWFLAFTLQNAAYVKAVGQVELIFSFLAARFVFGERAGRRELAGIALLALSVTLLVLVA